MSGLAGLLVKGLAKQLVKKSDVPSVSTPKSDVPSVSTSKSDVPSVSTSKKKSALKKIKPLNKKETEILNTHPDLIKELFSKDINDAVNTFENYGIPITSFDKPTKLRKGTTSSFKNKVYLQTQKSLEDQPDKMIIYRHGDLEGVNIDTGGPLSFTLSPFRGDLPGFKTATLDNFEAYEVNKKDILANYEKIIPDYSKLGTKNEREILVFPENVKLIEKFYKGGRVEKNPYGDYQPRNI